MSTLKLILALALLITFNAGATPFSPPLSADIYDSTPDGVPTPDDDNDGVPDLNDAVNLLLGTTFANNEDIDHLQIPTTADNAWISPTGEGTLVLIGLTAGFANDLGIYTDLGVGLLGLDVFGPFSGFGFAGDGTISAPFPGLTSPIFPTDPFGFRLNVDNDGTLFYFSEPSLNLDGFEHLVAYDLPGLGNTSRFIAIDPDPFDSDPTLVTVEHTFSDRPILVGWEDLPFGSPHPTSGDLLADDDYDDMMYIFDAVAPIRTDSSGSTVVFLTLAMAGLAAGLRKMKKFTS